MARKKARKLSNISQALLDAFASDAKTWGCMEEYGTGSSVSEAERDFDASKVALEKRILYLEAQLSYQTKRAKMYAPAKHCGMSYPVPEKE